MDVQSYQLLFDALLDRRVAATPTRHIQQFTAVNKIQDVANMISSGVGVKNDENYNVDLDSRGVGYPSII